MAVSALAVLPAPAHAQARLAINLSAGTLGNALIQLAQQAGVTIGSTDPTLARMAVPSLRGRFDVDTALKHLLRGKAVRAERIDAATWRIVAMPPARAKPPTAAVRVQDAPITEGDIVVTASKTGTWLSRYAGSASILSGADLNLAEAGLGSEALVERLPALSSTHLGSGRNKLFIRGIADSSFNGPSQALVGQYLGDVRLNYNAPDPDLSLYDIDSVELLEGPQGTLYGAGSLAGVLRVVPRPVAMDKEEGSFSASRSLTAQGAPSYDVVGMLNMPLTDRLGARVVAFGASDGGYIDDVGRGLTNVNRTHKVGGRAAVRADLGAWRVDVGAVVQNISTRDGQYEDTGLSPLSRANRVAQPFDNDYLLGSITVSRDFGATSLVSASAILHQTTDSRFDFTRFGAASPRIFDQQNRISLISNETRLSRRDADGRGWVIGVSFIQDEDKLTRALGSPSAPTRILGVANSVTEGALFGEAGFALTPRLIATVGARVEYDHLTGRALDRDAAIGEPRRDEQSFLPSLSLSWRAAPDLVLFARYQEGFRPGGLSVTPAGRQAVIERFHSDSIGSIEGGAKWRPAGATRFDVALTISHAYWTNIQADLVDTAGLPFTQNIGSGRIWGAEASFGWQPFRNVKITAATFANDSRLSDPESSFAATASSKDYELPNIAHFGASGRAAFEHGLAGDWRLYADARAYYVGHSRLGIGPQLALLQGNYFLAGSSVRIDNGHWGVSIDASNLLNSHGTMFALGNPFNVGAGRQSVPPRPRTIRMGIDAHF